MPINRIIMTPSIQRLRVHYNAMSDRVIDRFKNMPNIAMIPSENLVKLSKQPNAVKLFKDSLNDMSHSFKCVQANYMRIALNDAKEARSLLVISDAINHSKDQWQREDIVPLIYMGDFIAGSVRYDMPLPLAGALLDLKDVRAEINNRTKNDINYIGIETSRLNKTLRISDIFQPKDINNHGDRDEIYIDLNLETGEIVFHSYIGGEHVMCARYDIGSTDADLFCLDLIANDRDHTDFMTRGTIDDLYIHFRKMINDHIGYADQYRKARVNGTFTIKDPKDPQKQLTFISKCRQISSISYALHELMSVAQRYYNKPYGMFKTMIGTESPFIFSNMIFNNKDK